MCFVALFFLSVTLWRSVNWQECFLIQQKYLAHLHIVSLCWAVDLKLSEGNFNKHQI